jgi:hypothetical protein
MDAFTARAPWLAVFSLAIGSQAAGCGPSVQRAPTPPSALSQAPPAPAEPKAEPVATARLDLGSIDCALRAEGGLVQAECAKGALACEPIARADLAAPPGEEVVSRCDDPDESARALVVARGGALLWVAALDSSDFGADLGMCGLPPELSVTVVDPVPDPHKALLVTLTECEQPGAQLDADSLWKFRGGDAVPVATAALECEYLGDTSDPDAPDPPSGAAYGCTGGQLEVAPARGPSAVVWVKTDEMIMTGGERDAEGRLELTNGATTRQAMRWDPEAFRFVPKSP